MQTLSKEQRMLARKNAASYEKVGVKTMAFAVALLLIAVILMFVPSVNNKSEGITANAFSMNVDYKLFSSTAATTSDEELKYSDAYFSIKSAVEQEKTASDDGKLNLTYTRVKKDITSITTNNPNMIFAIIGIALLVGAVALIISNPLKNKVMLYISLGLNLLAIVFIVMSTVKTAEYTLGAVDYLIAGLEVLLVAGIMYLNAFQYIKGYGKYGFTFVVPFFLTFLIFQLYPIIFTFRTSLTDAAGWSKVLDNKVIGFDNFAKLFDFETEIASNFWESLGNTVIMWMWNFVPQIAMALILASWFTDTRMRLKFQGGFKVLIFMPNIITAATIGILFMSLFDYPVSPVNTLLQQFGLTNESIRFFRNVDTSRGIVSFIQWWMWYGNTMIIMIAGILGINPALFEAALVDGCSSRQTFWKITLPLIKPILLYNLVTSLVGGLTMFDIPHLMTQGNPNYTTNTVARFIYTQGFDMPNNFNVACAASVVLFGIIVICSLILSSIMKDRDVKKVKGVGK